MSKSKDRLRLGDKNHISQAFIDQGFAVEVRNNKVVVTHPEHHYHLCTLQWESPPRGVSLERKGGWQFTITLNDVYTHTDLRAVIAEVVRVSRLRPIQWDRWLAYRHSSSDTRWADYRLALCNLLMRNK